MLAQQAIYIYIYMYKLVCPGSLWTMLVEKPLMCDTCVETTEDAVQTEVHVHVLGIAVEEGSQTRGLLSQAGGKM